MREGREKGVIIVEEKGEKKKGKEITKVVTRISEATAERQELPNIRHTDIEVNCRLT